MIRLTTRLLRRDLAAADFRLLLIALVIAVAAITAVGMLAERVKGALTGQANWLLAADAALLSDHPLPQHYRNGQLRMANTATFPSMIRSDGRTMLAAIKAVSAHYPLRGKLDTTLGNAPAPLAGEAYIDRRIAEQWQLKPGSRFQLGQSTLTVRAVIVREPDAVIDFSSLQPRVLINEADLPATGLQGPGSRVKYGLLYAGEASAVAAWTAQLKPQLQRGERLEDAREARPEVKKALERADRFLQLAGLLAALLAGVAILLAARRFVQRHYDSVALLRTLGASQQQIRQLLGGELLALVLLASLSGGLLGWLGQGALAEIMGYWLESTGNQSLPASTPLPWLWACAYALLLLAGTAGPQLLALSRTPPLRVLRRELQPGLRLGLQWSIAALATLVLLWLTARDLKLALLTAGGLLLAVVLCGLGGWLLIRLLLSLPGAHWRLALRPLARQPGLAVVQLGALTLGITGLCLLTVTRNDLLAGWQQRVPSEAPNHFAINIQPEQAQPLGALFRAHGLSEPAFQPMIRGRWMARNGQPVEPASYPDERAQRLAEREFNLSWGEALRADNRLLAGRIPAAGEQGWTVEAGLAKTLGIGLGDTLEFDIAGTRVTAPVLALREVNWDSFRPNFFVTGTEGMLAGQPSSMITSFYLPTDRRGILPEIANHYPNITLLDIGQLLDEVRRILLLATEALQLVLAFCLAAGLTVLAAALELNAAERSREAALLRALGATQSRLRRLWLTEQSVLGAVSGLTAGMAASSTGWALGHFALEVPVAFNLWLPLLAMLAGMLLAVSVSMWRLQRLANSTPAALLR
ncbi:ABC transporter permease [Chitinilyticum piscinae]|uniref:FtsX-like permease family protein n=1 Tax=Chitinilyticum piscinae TaxID=2866724 RepID=A0A8J7FNX1_9NEIS|nr:FtsX-like permease family protein [Chitinilyticum piscinae]MBE9610291.1 FtsX-like permease family protein [Chitinilyticum piscinae]